MVGIVYYRAHEIAGNTAFVDALADAVEAAGAQPLPVYCGTLRGLDPTSAENAGAVRAAAQVRRTGHHAARSGRHRRGQRERRRCGRRLGRGRAGVARHPADPGPRAHLDPRAVAGERRGDQPARRRDPGRDPGVRRPDSSRSRSPSRRTTPMGWPATRRTRSAVPGWPESRSPMLGCGTSRSAEKKLALVLSSYPTKHARIGNAVGLDTPASAVVLLGQAQGRRLRPGRSGPRLTSAGCGRRRRPDPPADRRRRSRRRLADRRAARRPPSRRSRSRRTRSGSVRCRSRCARQ